MQTRSLRFSFSQCFTPAWRKWGRFHGNSPIDPSTISNKMRTSFQLGAMFLVGALPAFPLQSLMQLDMERWVSFYRVSNTLRPNNFLTRSTPFFIAGHLLFCRASLQSRGIDRKLLHIFVAALYHQSHNRAVFQHVRSVRSSCDDFTGVDGFNGGIIHSVLRLYGPARWCVLRRIGANNPVQIRIVLLTIFIPLALPPNSDSCVLDLVLLQVNAGLGS
jgi:hypothetical protein